MAWELQTWKPFRELAPFREFEAQTRRHHLHRHSGRSDRWLSQGKAGLAQTWR